jgi:hypothetical protein
MYGMCLDSFFGVIGFGDLTLLCEELNVLCGEIS